MLIKVFPHGQGGGDLPTQYLVRLDYTGRRESPPEVLRGDPAVTRALIDTLDFTWKFTAGALSWCPEDEVSEEQEQRLMDGFENIAFAGLEEDQRNILWVRHKHARHHDLHFLIPRVELASGKSFNAFPPGWEKDFGVLRDVYNCREQWADPNDPARFRLADAESCGHMELELSCVNHGAEYTLTANMFKDCTGEKVNIQVTGVPRNRETGAESETEKFKGVAITKSVAAQDCPNPENCGIDARTICPLLQVAEVLDSELIVILRGE
jgi:hypothetical protein